ncbi:glycosyltransferase family 1 protein [Pseudooceanicola sediminis]|uniref:Glycosyltransferase family 1 protein n=1 Tax=Pseudooceanicola sediminis TaxID=2211117 RepID=A0A399IXI2_9RHOB|nr:glycosyltransferase [Pseudooceanicola sediminis]KAA2311698.1 glycosyltransferase [Puniceibacterium sp. HSS470]RII37137.1 glycosyltransferase family 1 protein [Pseudooceanicola sediminis]|tara:strand:+ start:21070 stop:22200 length:1131 start_codon:yes stop_codon:yes gene_type:complete
MKSPRLRIVHETNPGKYFPALFLLADRGDVVLTGAHRYSVFKEWLRAWRRDRTPFAARTRNAAADMRLRMDMSRISGEVIVLGFAPWDPRLLIYRGLARRNRILYHTSWHDWGLDATPRQPRPAAFKRWLRDRWVAFMAHPNVQTIAVTPVVADAVTEGTGQQALVIPHAVPSVFFETGAARAPRETGPLKLLYVGEVSEKKGLRILLDMMQTFTAQQQPISLTIIGNGAMAGAAEAASAAAGARVDFRGPVHDRAALAAIMADHDVLMLLSQRTPTWEELFGIVIVEALAAGLAVVASDHVGPRGILPGGDGLFAEDAHAEVAAALRGMATDRTALAGLYARQAKACEPYHIDKVCESWRSAILRAAETDVPGGR